MNDEENFYRRHANDGGAKRQVRGVKKSPENERSKAFSSTRSTAPGDILPTADGHGSSSTAAVWCRSPMPHAVGHVQTAGTTRRISWRAISTRRSITTLAQGPR